VRPEVLALETVPSIEQQDADTLAREVPGRHPAGGTGADNDDVMSRFSLGQDEHVKQMRRG
jgi:hypothetical protein